MLGEGQLPDPAGTVVKSLPVSAGGRKGRVRSWVGRSPEEKWQPTLVLSPGDPMDREELGGHTVRGVTEEVRPTEWAQREGTGSVPWKEDRGALCHAQHCVSRWAVGAWAWPSGIRCSFPCHLRWGRFGVSNHVCDQKQGLGIGRRGFSAH